jgi:hypothetical protein
MVEGVWRHVAGMCPGHAAALALVGWYLMVPPPVIHSSVPVDLDAPLSKWGFLHTIDRKPFRRKGPYTILPA